MAVLCWNSSTERPEHAQELTSFFFFLKIDCHSACTTRDTRYHTFRFNSALSFASSILAAPSTPSHYSLPVSMSLVLPVR